MIIFCLACLEAVRIQVSPTPRPPLSTILSPRLPRGNLFPFFLSLSMPLSDYHIITEDSVTAFHKVFNLSLFLCHFFHFLFPLFRYLYLSLSLTLWLFLLQRTQVLREATKSSFLVARPLRGGGGVRVWLKKILFWSSKENQPKNVATKLKGGDKRTYFFAASLIFYLFIAVCLLFSCSFNIYHYCFLSFNYFFCPLYLTMFDAFYVYTLGPSFLCLCFVLSVSLSLSVWLSLSL